MIRSKGEAGTGNVVEAVRHLRQIRGDIAPAARPATTTSCTPPPRSCAPRTSWSRRSPSSGKLPVVLFTAGGVATPADAALMMQLGAEGVFVGSGIFKSGDPAKRAAAIVKATTFYDDPEGHRGGLPRPRRGHGRHQLRHPARRPSATPTAAGRSRPLPMGRPGACPSAVRPERHPRDQQPHRRRARPPGRRPRAPRRPRRGRAPRAGHGAPPRGAGRGRRRWSYPAASPPPCPSWPSPSACWSRCASGCAAGMPVYGSCAGMIMLADKILDGRDDQRDDRRHRHDRAPQRLRPAERVLRGRRRGRPASRAARSRASSSARRGSSRSAPASRCWPTLPDRTVVAVRQGNLLATSFHPELTGDHRVHRLFADTGAHSPRAVIPVGSAVVRIASG